MNRRDAIAGQNLFALTDPEFYEPLSRYRITDGYLSQLEQLLTPEWEIRREELWLHALSPASVDSSAPLVRQGFKIHVSSTATHALRVLALVVPVCMEARVSFKTAARPFVAPTAQLQAARTGLLGQVHDDLPRYAGGLL